MKRQGIAPPRTRPVQRPWVGCPRIRPKGWSDPGKARSVATPRKPRCKMTPKPLRDRRPDAIPTTTCRTSCRFWLGLVQARVEQCRVQSLCRADIDRRNPPGCPPPPQAAGWRETEKPFPNPKHHMRQDNMLAVSLTGRVHVNLADFLPNGRVYPWIGDRAETPDISPDTHEIFQNVSIISNT
jgi:hypothetical protein